jgi:hypothetical protein
MNKIIANCETGEILELPLNQEEIKQRKIDIENNIKIKNLEQAEAEAKESARQALLSKLGITQEEAQLLLGGK